MNRRQGLRVSTAFVVSAVLSAMAGVASAEQGIILADGSCVLTPYGELQAKYDSNVRRLSNDDKSDKDDMVGQLKIGSGIRNSASQLRLKGDLWGLSQRFTDLTNEDHDDFGQSASAAYGTRQALEVSVDESYSDSQNYDYGVGKIMQRADFSAGLTLASWVTQKTEAELTGKYSSSDYEAKSTFDYDTTEARLELAQSLTDKTSGLLIGRAGTINCDANKDPGNFYGARIGVKSVQTDKITGKASAGVRVQETDGDSLSLPDVSLAGDYKFSPTMTVRAGANTGVDPGASNSELGSYKQRTGADLSFIWACMDTVSLTLAGRYTQFDYNFAADADKSKERKEDTIGGSARLDYSAPGGNLSGYLEFAAENKQVEKEALGSEYDQNAVTVGARYAY